MGIGFGTGFGTHAHGGCGGNPHTKILRGWGTKGNALTDFGERGDVSTYSIRRKYDSMQIYVLTYFLSCIVPNCLPTIAYPSSCVDAPQHSRLYSVEGRSSIRPPRGFPGLELDCDFDPCAASSAGIFMCTCPTPSEVPSGTDTTDPWDRGVRHRMIKTHMD